MKLDTHDKAHLLQEAPSRGSVFGPYIEAALLTGMVGLFVAALGPQAGEGLPSPFWIPVLAMAAFRGTGPAALAALLATVLGAQMGWLAPQTSSGFYEDIIAQFDEPALWLLAALVVGEPTRLRLERHRALQKELVLEAERQRVVSLYAESLRQKIADLEHQIAAAPGQQTSFPVPLARLSADEMAQPQTLQRAITALFGSGSGEVFQVGPIAEAARAQQRILNADQPADAAVLRGFDLAIPLFDGKSAQVIAVLALRGLPPEARGMAGEACALLLAYLGQYAIGNIESDPVLVRPS